MKLRHIPGAVALVAFALIMIIAVVGGLSHSPRSPNDGESVIPAAPPPASPSAIPRNRPATRHQSHRHVRATTTTPPAGDSAETEREEIVRECTPPHHVRLPIYLKSVYGDGDPSRVANKVARRFGEGPQRTQALSDACFNALTSAPIGPNGLTK